MLTDDDTRRQHDVEIRAKEMTESLIINDTVHFSDMTLEDGDYSIDCRCGGSYVAHAEQCGISSSNREHVVVPCDTCSLHIKIVFTDEF